MTKILPTLILLLAAASPALGIGPLWYSCDSANCAGDCHCPSNTSPGGFAPTDIPQFVLITHDDAITSLADHGVRSITDGHKNPNGCNVPATWFTTSTGTDCALAKKLYDQNHEIALHTVHHAELVPAMKNMEQEIMGAKTAMIDCGIPAEAMNGFRSPYLIHNPAVRSILEKNGFLYDSSIDEYVSPESLTTNSFGQRLWPYTFDFGIAQDCNWTIPSGQCTANERYLGMWEVPMYDMPNSTVSTEKNAYTMDYDVGFGGDLYTTLTTNFDQTYNGNRAPFPFYVHAPWFTEDHIAQTNKFFDHALSKPDVYFVTIQQLINWMKNPVPASQVGATLKCNPVDLSPPEKLKCQLYTVQSGDYMDAIAGKFGIVDTKSLVDLNPTAARNIQPGQKLKIPPWDDTCGAGVPSGTAASSMEAVNNVTPDSIKAPTVNAPTGSVSMPTPSDPAAAVVPEDRATDCKTWTVTAGQQSLTWIADQTKANIADLISVNGLSGATATLTPGQVLKIPPFPDSCTAPPLVAETETNLGAQPMQAATSDLPGNRVELFFNLRGMSPADFEMNARAKFSVSLAQLLEVPSEMLAVGAGARRRSRRALQQDPMPVVKVLAVVSTADQGAVYSKAQSLIQNGDMDSLLNSLGLTPEGPPTITAYKDGAEAEVVAEAAPSPASGTNSTSKGKTAIIVGSIVGGVLVLIAVTVSVVLCLRKRRAKRNAEEKRTEEEAARQSKRYVGAMANLSLKSDMKKSVDDPSFVVKGGVDTPTSPTQRNYFKV